MHLSAFWSKKILIIIIIINYYNNPETIIIPNTGVLTYFLLPYSYKADGILQMRKMGHREVKALTRGAQHDRSEELRVLILY